jgi:hypothetical protein
MPIANIELPDGTKVTVDGSPEEIARVLSLYHQPRAASQSSRPDHATQTPIKKPRKARRSGAGPRSRKGAIQHIRVLIADKFFDERQTLAAVRVKLEEHGHIYSQNQISTPLRRLVLRRELRRLRDGKNWIYVIAR